MSSIKAWLLVGLLAVAVPASTATLTLDDLFGSEGAADVAVSPSGRYLAAVVRRKDDDLLVVQDLTTGESRGLTRVGRKDVGKLFDSRCTSTRSGCRCCSSTATRTTSFRTSSRRS